MSRLIIQIGAPVAVAAVAVGYHAYQQKQTPSQIMQAVKDDVLEHAHAKSTPFSFGSHSYDFHRIDPSIWQTTPPTLKSGGGFLGNTDLSPILGGTTHFQSILGTNPTLPKTDSNSNNDPYGIRGGREYSNPIKNNDPYPIRGGREYFKPTKDESVPPAKN